MNLQLPSMDQFNLQNELADIEPLQPARLSKVRNEVPALRDVPNIGISPRFLRSANWAPPTLQPNSNVAVYYVTDTGFKTEAVEPAKVVCYMAEERQAVVRLRSGARKAVPASWVLDPSLAGTARHPWRGGGCGGQAQTYHPSAPSTRQQQPSGQKEVVDSAGLKEALIDRYGSVIDAWEAIDVLNSGEAMLDAFVLACRHIRYHGDLAAVFAEIADIPPSAEDGAAGATITLRHFKRWMEGYFDLHDASSVLLPSHHRSTSRSKDAEEPSSQELRSAGAEGARRFRLAMLRQFDSLAAAWCEFDTNRDGVLQFHEFCAACRRLTFRGNLKQVWEVLVEGEPLPEPGLEADEEQRVVRPERLDPRLPGLLEKFLGPNSLRLITDHSPRRRFVAKAAANWPDTGWDPPPKTSRRSSLMVASDAKAFRDAMVKKFGSLALAWEELDPQGRGSLDYPGFVLACRHVDFHGNFKQVFGSLAGGKDVVKPADLDPGLPLLLSRCGSKSSRRSSLGSPPNSARGAPPSARGSNLPRASLLGLLAPEDAGPRFQETRRRSAETLAEVHAALNSHSERAGGAPSDAAAFRSALVKKFGSYAAAWPELDTRGRGELHYRDFVAACRCISFAGNLRQIFEELAGGSEVLRPDDLYQGLESILAKPKSAASRSGEVHSARGAAAVFSSSSGGGSNRPNVARPK